MNWLQDAVNGYKKLLELGLELNNNDLKKSIEYANENSTVGKKAKELALLELGL